MNQVFGYARVSTAYQNTDTQMDALQKFGCHRIFQENISGMATHRPALDEMLSLLREGDTVVVSRFSRLGRSRDRLINLIGDFAHKGIIFNALDFGIDASTAAGKLVIGNFAALTEYDGNGRLARDDSRKKPRRSTAGQSQGEAHWPTIRSESRQLHQNQEGPGKGSRIEPAPVFNITSI